MLLKCIAIRLTTLIVLGNILDGYLHFQNAKPDFNSCNLLDERALY